MVLHAGRRAHRAVASARLRVQQDVPVHVVIALESLGADGVEELLRLRADLAAPSGSLRDLGARALHPQSLSIVLRSFDTPTLQVAEVLAALASRADRPTLEALLGVPPGAAGRVPRAVLDRSLATLRRNLFLQVHDEPRLLPEIARAWPAPLGLGPSAAELLAAMPVTSLRAGLGALGVHTKKTLKADLVAVLAAALSDADLVRNTVEQAPPAVAARVRKAPFGGALPPHYLLSPYSVRTYGGRGIDKDPTLWALAHLLAVQTYEGVVMPAEVAMALRGPDWHVSFAHHEPPLVWGPRTRTDDGGAAAAGQAVRTVTGLVEALIDRPLQRLKPGAVGVRELRRLAKEQGAGVPEVRLGLSLAHQARLLTSTPRGIGVTKSARAWLRRSPAARAADLMSQWLHLPDVPTLDAEGPWGPHTSQRLLDVKTVVLVALATRPGQAPEPGSLLSWLTWAHPVIVGNRITAVLPPEGGDVDVDDPDEDLDDDVSRPPDSAQEARTVLDAVLTEATLLGIIADGALTQVGA